MSGIINTGISALNAFKRQLETTGHNIANVNTPGYSRQIVGFDAREPQSFPQGFVGRGVDISSIRRAYDEHLTTRVRDYSSSYQEFAVYEARARQIDDVIADAAAGIDGMMQQYFAAVSDVADDPTSIPARQVMINRGNQLADRFEALDGWFEDLRTQLNRELGNQVDEINSLSSSIAAVNGRIAAMTGATGQAPNDALDERDRLIDKLSQITNVTTLEQDDGALNVFIGTGQSIVVGSQFNPLALASNALAADQREIVIRHSGGAAVNVTAQMTGGAIGGLLRFRDEVLDETQNALGRVAIGLGTFINEEHRTGMDLDGQLGGDFFSVATPQVLAGRGNAGSLAVGFDDVGQLTTHDYQLVFDGASWTLTDLDDAVIVPMGGSGTGADPFTAHGLSIVVSGGAAGDTYQIRPTRSGATSLSVLIANERDIAAADPIRTAAASSNAGTGSIGGGALTSLAGGASVPTSPAVTLAFQAGNQLAITAGPAGTTFVDASGNPIAGAAAYNAGDTYRVEIPNLGIFEFDMTGTPQVGDSFSLTDNTGALAGTGTGVGDNRNARRLADLQNARVMLGGTASFANTYGSLVADVGSKTHQAANNAEVQKNLLSQAEASKSEVSGVNLDEEAADLVRFQQAYQAAAQVINVANSLFDTLLGAVRG